MKFLLSVLLFLVSIYLGDGLEQFSSPSVLLNSTVADVRAERRREEEGRPAGRCQEVEGSPASNHTHHHYIRGVGHISGGANNTDHGFDATRYRINQWKAYFSKLGDVVHRNLTGEEEESEEQLLAYILFFLFIYLIGSLLYFAVPLLFQALPFCPPISIVWFCFGFILQVIGRNFDWGMLGEGIRLMGMVPSDIIYMVFLPVLLYEGATGTNWHKFTRMLRTSLLLAYAGVAFTAVCLGLLFKATFSVFVGGKGWWEAMVLGSAVSSTDPVAVISVLKSLGCPEKMLSMFEGESLINDGTSVAFYQFFRVFAAETNLSAGQIVWLVVRLLCLGPLFGGAWSFVTCVVVQYFHGFANFQIVFILTNLYFTFFVGEHFCGLSGPLSAVFFGLYVCARGRKHLEFEAYEVHHHFVSTIAAFAESAIFMISGHVAFRVMESVRQDYPAGRYGDLWLDSFIVYLYMTAVRLVLFCLVFPYLRKSLYGFNWRELVVLVWGGLRGAIVLAVALMIESEAGTGPNHYRQEFTDFATFCIAGAVFFILAVNGTSFEPLFNFINPYPCKPFRRVYLTKVMKEIDEKYSADILEGPVRLLWLLHEDNTIDVLSYADKVVPKLGWRDMDRLGRIPTKLPCLRKIIKEMIRDSKDASARGVIFRYPSVKSVATKGHEPAPRNPSSMDLLTRRTTNSFDPSSNFQILEHHNHEGHHGHHRDSLLIGAGGRKSDLDDEDEFPKYKGDLENEATGPHRRSTLPAAENNYLHRQTLAEVETFCGKEGETSWDAHMIRKDRISEVHIMVCNTLMARYREFLEDNYVCGKAFRALEKSLDVVMDFSVSLLQKDSGAQVWQAVFNDSPTHHLHTAGWNFKDFKNKNKEEAEGDACQIGCAFELEWKALVGFLNTRRRFHKYLTRYRKFIPNLVWQRHVLRACCVDMQIVVVYVYAHEALLNEGSESFHRMLRGEMLTSFKAHIKIAKAFLQELRMEYPEAYNFAVMRILSTHLLNGKKELISEYAARGLLMEEDRQTLCDLFERQLYRVDTWHHRFMWM